MSWLHERRPRGAQHPTVRVHQEYEAQQKYQSFLAHEVGRKRKGSKESWPGHGREESYSKVLQSRAQRAKLNPHRSLAPWPDDWLAETRLWECLHPVTSKLQLQLQDFLQDCKTWTVTRPFGCSSGAIFTSETADGESWDALNWRNSHKERVVQAEARWAERHGSGLSVADNVATVQHRSTADVFQIHVILFSAFCYLLLTHTEFPLADNRGTPLVFISFTVMIP